LLIASPEGAVLPLLGCDMSYPEPDFSSPLFGSFSPKPGPPPEPIPGPAAATEMVGVRDTTQSDSARADKISSSELLRLIDISPRNRRCRLTMEIRMPQLSCHRLSTESLRIFEVLPGKSYSI